MKFQRIECQKQFGTNVQLKIFIYHVYEWLSFFLGLYELINYMTYMMEKLNLDI